MLWGLQRRFAAGRDTTPADAQNRAVSTLGGLLEAIGDMARGRINAVTVVAPVKINDTIVIDALGRDLHISCSGTGSLLCPDGLDVMFDVSSNITGGTPGKVTMTRLKVGTSSASPETFLRIGQASVMSVEVSDCDIYAATNFIGKTTPGIVQQHIYSKVVGNRLFSADTSSPASITAGMLSSTLSGNICNTANFNLNNSSSKGCVISGNVMRVSTALSGGNINVSSAAGQYNVIDGNVLAGTLTYGADDTVGDNS